MNPATPSDPAPLTSQEQAVLAAISAHEHRWDAGFADALSMGAPPAPARRRGVLLLLLVVAAVVVGPMVLPAAWVLAIAAVALLVVIPTTLVVWALRQGRVYPS